MLPNLEILSDSNSVSLVPFMAARLTPPIAEDDAAGSGHHIPHGASTSRLFSGSGRCRIVHSRHAIGAVAMRMLRVCSIGLVLAAGTAMAVPAASTSFTIGIRIQSRPLDVLTPDQLNARNRALYEKQKATTVRSGFRYNVHFCRTNKQC